MNGLSLISSLLGILKVSFLSAYNLAVPAGLSRHPAPLDGAVAVGPKLESRLDPVLRQLWRGVGRGRTAVVERVATKRASTVRTAARATDRVLELSFCGVLWGGKLFNTFYFRALLSRAQAEKSTFVGCGWARSIR
jgi:hypothetical protein